MPISIKKIHDSGLTEYLSPDGQKVSIKKWRMKFVDNVKLWGDDEYVVYLELFDKNNVFVGQSVLIVWVTTDRTSWSLLYSGFYGIGKTDDDSSWGGKGISREYIDSLTISGNELGKRLSESYSICQSLSDELIDLNDQEVWRCLVSGYSMSILSRSEQSKIHTEWIKENKISE